METVRPAMPVNASAKLFTANAVGLHALLFGPLVGGGMAAANWARAGDVRRARLGAAIAVGVSVFMIGFGAFAPPAWESLKHAVTVGGTAGFTMVLWQEQRALWRAHADAGGKAASPLAGTFAGLCIWILVFWAFVSTTPS